MYDVVVVGAGPAGSVTASLLSRKGVRVLLLDRSSFPRDKLCGDTLNPGTLAILRGLEIPTRAESLGLPLEGMLLTGEGGTRVEGRYPGGLRARALRRRELDEDLLATAVRDGAQIIDGVAVRSAIVDEERGLVSRVRGVTFDGSGAQVTRVAARLVIAADGRHSRVAFSLGLAHHPPSPRRWAAGTYFTNVAGLRNLGEMHVRRDRYIGVAPLPGGLVNVCVVTAGTPALRHPRELVLDTLASDPELRERFAHAEVVAPPVVLGPLAVDTTSSGAPGLLLAGDAAGFVDPMTGDGLRFAFKGAELAAAAALELLAHGNIEVHKRLDRYRRDAFGAKLRFNRAIRSLVGTAAGVRAASMAGKLVPSAVARLVTIAGDVTLTA